MFWAALRERSRSRAVKIIGPQDRVAEPDFERFVQQAADAFAAPIALLTLIDSDTLWVKAATGLDLGCHPRKDSFCTHAVDQGAPLEVCDALADSRFQSLPAVVGEPHIRYYLGAPLTLVDGTDVGALCVLDTSPRPPVSRDQRAYLVGLARQATQSLERRAHVRGRAAA